MAKASDLIGGSNAPAVDLTKLNSVEIGNASNAEVIIDAALNTNGAYVYMILGRRIEFYDTSNNTANIGSEWLGSSGSGTQTNANPMQGFYLKPGVGARFRSSGWAGDALFQYL